MAKDPVKTRLNSIVFALTETFKEKRNAEHYDFGPCAKSQVHDAFELGKLVGQGKLPPPEENLPIARTAVGATSAAAYDAQLGPEAPTPHAPTEIPADLPPEAPAPTEAVQESCPDQVDANGSPSDSTCTEEAQ